MGRCRAIMLKNKNNIEKHISVEILAQIANRYERDLEILKKKNPDILNAKASLWEGYAARI